MLRLVDKQRYGKQHAETAAKLSAERYVGA